MSIDFRSVVFLLLNILISTNQPVFADSDVELVRERSKDTHAIDQLPSFHSKEETPSETVERETERQINDSIRNDEDTHDTSVGPGKVLVTPAQKMEASTDSTKITKDQSGLEAKISPRSKMRRPSIALALGGGGIRGAAHIGVLRILKKEGIPIDYIVGNSMGAIVGGLYSAGVPLDDIEKMMLDGSLRKAFLPGMIPPKILISPIERLTHPGRKNYAGLWSGKKLSQFLNSKLPPGIENIEDTPVPFSAVATNLIDGKAYRISNGNLSTAMRASASVPSLLQPVAIGDKVFVDGAVRANMPASAARDTGADIVIAILVDEPLLIMPAKQFRSLKGIVSRLSDVMMSVSDAHQLPFADIVINPDVSGIPMINGHPDDARKAILAGETATQKAIVDIKKKLAVKMKTASK